MKCTARALLFLILWAFFAAGCATSQTRLTDPEHDPWEAYNRKVYAFNEDFDRAILRPVAKGYDYIMPDGPQRGVRNFFRNLGYPVTLVNSLLQGKLEHALDATGRFVMNSTIGLLGFFDVASKAGIPKYDEDFGQTLAVWGWKDSRYLVVPFLGPNTVRDLLGRGANNYIHPVGYMIRKHNDYWPFVIDMVSLRAELLPLQENIDAAADPYALVRDIYLQNRLFDIYDGNQPAPDYDSMLDDD